MKTVKFAEVVKRCGEPSIHLAWVDPSRDKTLKRALNEHRVMTLHQELHGGKKDFGSVGFLKDRHAQLLVFPKSLRKFAGRKVIAVDYALIAKEQVSGDALVADRPKSRSKAPKPAKPEPLPSLAEKIPAANPEISPRLEFPESKKKKPTAIRESAGTKKILGEVSRAVAELSAGKAVPAYQRLQRLLESHGRMESA